MVRKKKHGLIPLTKQRLDVVLVRAKFVLTLSQARQLISHRQVYVNGIVITSSFFVLKKRDIISVFPSIKKVVKHKIKQSIQTQNSIVSQYTLFEVKYITQKIVNFFDSLKTNKGFKLNLEKLALTTSYQVICVLFLLYSTYILKFSEDYFLALFLASFIGNIIFYKVLSKIDILVTIPLLLSSIMYFLYSPCFVCVEFLIYLPVFLIFRIITEFFFPWSETIHKYGWFLGVAMQTTCYVSHLVLELSTPSSASLADILL